MGQGAAGFVKGTFWMFWRPTRHEWIHLLFQWYQWSCGFLTTGGPPIWIGFSLFRLGGFDERVRVDGLQAPIYVVHRPRRQMAQSNRLTGVRSISEHGSIGHGKWRMNVVHCSQWILERTFWATWVSTNCKLMHKKDGVAPYLHGRTAEFPASNSITVSPGFGL